MYQKFILEWENLSVNIIEKNTSFWTTKTRKKNILNNVSGLVHSNSLVAIMGSSGSSKTTFLGAISGRLIQKSGVIRLNGNIITSDVMKNISGYIQQNDIFTETLTVNEHMTFMAALKLSQKTNYERLEIIRKLIYELSLNSHKNTLIKYLSGGERRRLSFATELLNDPLILFCDEPITGLDSYSAINVVQKLKNTSNSGKLVMTTLHQPSSDLFNYFDNIILLALGKLAFQGSRDEAKQFFDSIQLHCPLTFNRAEFYIKCITLTQQSSSIEKINKICDVFEEKQRNSKDRNPILISPNGLHKQKKQKSSFWNQLLWLIWRSFKDSRRNFSDHIFAYILIAFTGLTISGCYTFMSLTDPHIIQNTQGLLLLLVSELTFTSMYAVVFVFPSEIIVFLKEKSIYNPLPYFISKIIVLMPICLLNSFTFLILSYILLSIFTGIYEFINMWCILFYTSLAASCLGLAFSATLPSYEYMDLILVPLETIAMVLSGIWIKLDSLSPYIGWLKYLSPFYLSFESMSFLHWKSIDGHLSNCVKNETMSCYIDGDQALKAYGFLKNYNVVATNILYLHLMIIAYSLIGFLGILRRKMYYSSY